MANIDEGEVQSLADGGYAKVIRSDGTLRRLPVATIAAALEPARTAVQPEDIGSMARPHSVNVQIAAAARADLQALFDRVAAMEGFTGG